MADAKLPKETFEDELARLGRYHRAYGLTPEELDRAKALVREVCARIEADIDAGVYSEGDGPDSAP